MKIAITSVHNSLIKHVSKLALAKNRYEHKQFIAEGFRTCSTLIQAGIHAQAVFIVESLQTDATVFDKKTPVYSVSLAVMKKISQSSTPSGLLAVFSMPPQPSLLEHIGPGIILYELQDPGNVGTLIRTCAALAKKTVVFIDGVDPWHPKVIQASAGTIGDVTIFKTSWQTVQTLHNKPRICALTPTEGSHPMQVPLNDSLLLIGSEAHGLPPDVIAACDYTVTLPMPGSTESLNAAIAGSIALYLGALQTGAL